MKASLSNYRQSPRKVRLIASLVKGKSVPEALSTLQFLIKRGSAPVKKVIESAAANTRIPREDLMVKKITVNKGIVLKRSMPRARGSAFPIKKRTSHIDVELAQK